MKLQKGLTVVILTYNSASTIQKCLDCMVEQKYGNFTLLIVDDNSTDNTIELIKRYKKKLTITIVKNGAHSISRGRNIGLKTSRTEYVAFTDSDDFVAPEWTQAIIDAFSKQHDLALITGAIVPMSYTQSSEAIALNDATIRKLFGKGVFLFSGGNCAFNKKLIGSFFFDEDFMHAEDSELFSRVKESYGWEYVADMKVHCTSRTTLKAYAKQMYFYGLWRLYYEYKSKDFRIIDFIPLSIMILSAIVSVMYWSWFPLLAIVFFSLAEALFVSIYQRCELQVAILTFPAWLVKNISWSVGIAQAIITLILNTKFRNSLISKRVGIVK